MKSSATKSSVIKSSAVTAAGSDDLHALPVDKVFAALQSSEEGLTSHEAEKRIHQYGLNELPTKAKINFLKILLRQFSSPLVIILIAALVISIFIGEKVDALVIGAIVLINSLLGFFQEERAEKALEALQKLASSKATVIRDGKEAILDSKYLVPGDVVILKSGDKVPADARWIEVHDLETQEAALTGESQPIEKKIEALTEKTELADRNNMAYASTIISSGRGKAMVAYTGLKTEVGKIADIIKETQDKTTPLQKKLRDLGKYISIAVMIVAVFIFATGALSGLGVTEMFLTALALAVAAIPEGLPAIITISLAHGVQRMVKKKALIRKLPSVETLGSVNVICTDKTGTLTHNEMTVTKIWVNDKTYDVTGSGYERKGVFLHEKEEAAPEELELLLKAGALCNDAEFESSKKNSVIGDPTEAALLVSAEKMGFKRDGLEHTEPRVDEISFTSERKMMTTIHKTKKGLISYTKGAPDIVLERCNKILVQGKVYRLDRHKKKEILGFNELFAGHALRVLSFAFKNDIAGKEHAESDMIFIGLQAMIDPPRAEVKEAIKKCEEAGIRVVMITGDHIITAKAIAEQLGIFGKAVTGQELDELRSLDAEIERINIFARVNPEHKLKIVTALKRKGYVVAVTGDGINDAPALKKGDIGIAMGVTGTDVAKEASDMILTDDNFTSIVNAIEEGRGIYDNIRKFVNYLLSSNLAEVLVIFLGMIIFAPLFGLGLPLTPIHILWINLVTDGLPAIALGLDPFAEGIMKRKPRKTKEPIITKEMLVNILVLGSVMAIMILALFWLYKDSLKAQTVAFTALVVFELVRLHMIRSQYRLPIFSNLFLISAVAVSFLLQIVILYIPAFADAFGVVPLEFLDWVWIITAALSLVGINKIIGFIRRKGAKSTA